MYYKIPVIFLECGHEEARVFDGVQNRNKQKPSRKLGWFRSLFSVKSSKHKAPAGMQYVQDYCSYCKEIRRTTEEKWRRKDEEIKEQNRQLAEIRTNEQNKLKRQKSQGEQLRRTNFHCSSCKAEGRYPDLRVR
jgi:hypothetical protein